MAHKPKPPYTKKDSIEAATGDEESLTKMHPEEILNNTY